MVLMGVAIFIIIVSALVIYNEMCIRDRPYGLQAAAGSLLWALDGGKSALYRFLAS